MKNIVIALIVILGAYSFLRTRNEAAPQAIADPVYSDTRVSMKTPDGSIDIVILMKTIDHADCEAETRKLEKDLGGGGFASCEACTTPRSQCMTELPPRFASMFENRPSSVTYLSLARGSQAERDLRVVYWGVTVEQSDRVCDAVPEFQKGRKGAVSCVRAQRA